MRSVFCCLYAVSVLIPLPQAYTVSRHHGREVQCNENQTAAGKAEHLGKPVRVSAGGIVRGNRLAGLAALSGLLLLSDLSEWISALLLGLLLFCSGYSMGRFAGFHRRRKGWLTGLCCGLLLCGILLAVGLFWQGTAGSPVRLLLICGGSIWGGISGVNAPHKKPPK